MRFNQISVAVIEKYEATLRESGKIKDHERLRFLINQGMHIARKYGYEERSREDGT